MKILVLYHFYFPDDVVSAIQYTDLSEGLAKRGFEVEVWPCNHSCHGKETYVLNVEKCEGVKVNRIWRPGFPQHSFLGRILNSIWMQKAWSWRLLFTPSLKPDIIITGTDPIFSVGLSTFLKFIRPKAKIVHWCFDLYPEAAIADGIAGENNPVVNLLRYGLKRAYKKNDLVADLGPCMREKLKLYGIGQPESTLPSSRPSPATDSTGLTVRGEGNGNKGEGVKGKTKVVTLTPWALEEPSSPLPSDPAERKELFGDAKLALLYSGSFGRAHDYPLTLMLARKLRAKGAFAYSARGSRLDELKRFITPEDANIRFTDFAPQEKLAARLSSPDVHIVSLRPEWTGTVVPSKFFGALAIGRPVLFEGGQGSSIFKWIEEYKVGWVLKMDNLDQIAKELVEFSQSQGKKDAMFKHCHEVYQAHFSKNAVIDRWNNELRSLLAE